MTIPFVSHALPGGAMEFSVNGRRQAIQRGRVSIAPGLEQTGQIGRAKTLKLHRSAAPSGFRVDRMISHSLTFSAVRRCRDVLIEL
jgi:hypothetical protein